MVDHLLPGDIILFRGMDEHRHNKNWLRYAVSWCISKLTGSTYTHAALYYGNGRVLDTDVGRAVSVRQLSEYEFYDVYRVQNATNEDRQRAVYFCAHKIGKRYDYTAVLSIALEKFGIRCALARADPDRWFCSELIADAWRLSNDISRVAPGDLAKCVEVNQVDGSPAQLAIV